MSTREEMEIDSRRDAAENREKRKRWEREIYRTPEDDRAPVVCRHGNEVSAFWGPCEQCELEDGE